MAVLKKVNGESAGQLIEIKLDSTVIGAFLSDRRLARRLSTCRRPSPNTSVFSPSCRTSSTSAALQGPAWYGAPPPPSRPGCATSSCASWPTRARTFRPRSPNRNPIREFDVPFGASGANIAYALLMQAHIAQYGTTAEDFAAIAASARANAQLNPDAIFYGKPATVADVLASPMIASPLHLYEIVMPVAGGEAVVVVSPARARTMKQRPVHLLGAGEKVTHRAVSQAPDLTSGPLKPAMAQAMTQAGVTADRMSLYAFYDCYTVMAAITIEDAGLCPPGGFGHWMRENDLGPTGSAPFNTHGGQIGFGQPDLAGGMTHVVEAVRQLRGTAEGRQIADADLALVTGNGATMSEAVALVLGADA